MTPLPADMAKALDALGVREPEPPKPPRDAGAAMTRFLAAFTALLLVYALALGAVVSEREMRAWSPLALTENGKTAP